MDLKPVPVPNSVDQGQGQRPVGPDLDLDCLHIISLHISEEMFMLLRKIGVVFTTLIYMLMCRLKTLLYV